MIIYNKKREVLIKIMSYLVLDTCMLLFKKLSLQFYLLSTAAYSIHLNSCWNMHTSISHLGEAPCIRQDMTGPRLLKRDNRLWVRKHNHWHTLVNLWSGAILYLIIAAWGFLITPTDRLMVFCSPTCFHNKCFYWKVFAPFTINKFKSPKIYYVAPFL